MVQQYLQTIAMNVAKQGKPTGGNYLTVMAERVKAEIKAVVPPNYRLAVRMAIRRHLSGIQTALVGI